MLPFVKKALNAKQLWRKAAFSITALNRMSSLASGHLSSGAQELSDNVKLYKEESDREVMETASIMHHHNENHPSEDSETLKKQDDISVDGTDADTLVDQFAKTSLNDKEGRGDKKKLDNKESEV